MGSDSSPPAMANEPTKTDVSIQNEVKELDSSGASTTTEEMGEKRPTESLTDDATAPSSPSAEEGPQEGDAANDYLTGFKLFSLLASTGLIFFVLLLDSSIISTVSE